MSYSNDAVYLDANLVIWGAWLDRIIKNEEGWPSASLIVSILELGTFTPSICQTKIPKWNQVADEMNAHINRLKRKHPKFVKALFIYYTRAHGKPLKVIAQEEGLSVRTLRQHAKLGKEELLKAMRAKNDFFMVQKPLDVLPLLN